MEQSYINKSPTRYNSMQSDLFYCKITLHVSGVHRTHHQEYSLLLPSKVAKSGPVPTWPRWREVAVPILWPVPEAAVTVFSTPDDGCSGRPKHVEWFCCEINQTAYCCIWLDFYEYWFNLNSVQTISKLRLWAKICAAMTIPCDCG